MFYRRKVILALLEVFGGQLPQINLYKLLLIFTKQQHKPDYDFVPYQYGCYSFSLSADIDTMCRKEMLRKDDNKSLVKIDKTKYLANLTEADNRIILSIHTRFADSTADDLMKYTYTRFPYTAISSSAAQRLLSVEELNAVNNCKPYSDSTTLFTIGYEGISLEEYLNRLIQNDVKVLVDVRNNPVSMKFGFSKSLLYKFCDKLGIEYIHIPEVGIQGGLRQELNTQADYDKLFRLYKKKNLTITISHQEQILALLKTKKRIALTCFEANICQCHRKHLAEAITDLPGWDYELKHI